MISVDRIVAKKLGIKGGGVVIVRPDGHIGYVSCGKNVA